MAKIPGAPAVRAKMAALGWAYDHDARGQARPRLNDDNGPLTTRLSRSWAQRVLRWLVGRERVALRRYTPRQRKNAAHASLRRQSEHDVSGHRVSRPVRRGRARRVQGDRVPLSLRPPP